MLHPSRHALERPEQAAIIMANTGTTISYRELEASSNRGAHLFRKLGLKRGDHIALLMENHPAFFEICWAAQRAGLYYTPISYYLKPDEMEYIINNCEAKVFIASYKQHRHASTVIDRIPKAEHRFMVDGCVEGFVPWETAVEAMPITPIADQSEGREMLYSSGTTGKPKGIKFALPKGGLGEAEEITRSVGLCMYIGVTHDTVALSTAPVYHSAPLGFVMGAHRIGCSVVIMEKFDAEDALRLIEKYKVGYSQWVPTMFVRLMKLPESVRNKYDVSSMKMAIHGSAPCPVDVKEQIIRWWGPVSRESDSRKRSSVVANQSHRHQYPELLPASYRGGDGQRNE